VNCDEVRELAGAYALDALSPEELREVREHLVTCNLHDLAALRATALLLPGAVEERTPPDALRARILDAARASPSPSRTAAERRPALRDRWRIRRMRGADALVGILALVVIGLLGLGLVLRSGASQHEIVRAVSAGPAAGTELRYLPDERVAVLDVKGLPPLPPGRTYQVWMIRGGTPQGVALFNAPGTGAARVAFAEPLRDGDLVAVTVEPAGGSPLPTTEPLFAISF
jgi:anti-sigma-K factor RskA